MQHVQISCTLTERIGELSVCEGALEHGAHRQPWVVLRDRLDALRHQLVRVHHTTSDEGKVPVTGPVGARPV